MPERKPLTQREWDLANGSEAEAWRQRYIREQRELGRDVWREQISADDMDNDYTGSNAIFDSDMATQHGAPWQAAGSDRPQLDWMIMDIKETPVVDVPSLPARSVVMLHGVAWQKQALPLNGWTSTEATWLSNGVMCDREGEITLLWNPNE